MTCSACGHLSPEGSSFCEACGARLERACRACGTPASPGARFCRGCGTPFDAGGTRPSPLPPPAPERDPRTYTPKHLADKILQSKSALEGERKQVTVLFADVKGSLELAESLDPEEWHRILERFFEILSEGVHRFEGTVNQYTGDGIMALFGAPIAHEDHAQRAKRGGALAVSNRAEGICYGLPARRVMVVGSSRPITSATLIRAFSIRRMSLDSRQFYRGRTWRKAA